MPIEKRVARAEVAVSIIGVMIVLEAILAIIGLTNAWLLAAGLTPMLWININVIRKARRDHR